MEVSTMFYTCRYCVFTIVQQRLNPTIHIIVFQYQHAEHSYNEESHTMCDFNTIKISAVDFLISSRLVGKGTTCQNMMESYCHHLLFIYVIYC